MTDPSAPTPRGAIAWTSAVIATAAVLLLLFNPASLTGWLAQHPPDAAPPVARGLVQSWSDTASRLGLTAPRAAIERVWKAARDAGWPGAPGGERPQR